MGREEHWRQRLLELKEDLSISQAAMAASAGIDPSYLSRLLYPPGKNGRKNLGLESMDAFKRAYGLPADWFDLPLGSALPSGRQALKPGMELAMQDAPAYVVQLKHHDRWPFPSVTRARIESLKSRLGPKVGAEAIRDIDSLLDVAVAKWERIAVTSKKQSGR